MFNRLGAFGVVFGTACALTLSIGNPIAGAAGLSPADATGYGKVTAHLDSPENVVGGSDAVITDAPWQVALLRNNPTRPTKERQFCGGSIISPEWILTAAHCVVPSVFPGPGTMASKIVVLSGTDQLSRTNPSPGVQTTVSSVTIHPGYDAETDINDVALLRLDKPLNLNSENQKAISLPKFTNWPLSSTPALITGWGNTSSSGGDYPTQLQKATVQVIGSPTSYFCGSYKSGDYQPDTMLCAGIPQTGGIDTCQGDSGGPLAVVADGKHYLAGVTSWGAGCATPGYPGVYARVTTFVTWIESIMKTPVGAIQISSKNALEAGAHYCVDVVKADNSNSSLAATKCAEVGQGSLSLPNIPSGKYKVYFDIKNSNFSSSAWWNPRGPQPSRAKAGVLQIKTKETVKLPLQFFKGGTISINIEGAVQGASSLVCFSAYRVGSTQETLSTCRNPLPAKVDLTRLPVGNYHIKIEDRGMVQTYPTQWYKGTVNRKRAIPVEVSHMQETSVALNVTRLEAPPWRVVGLSRSGFSSGDKRTAITVSWKKPTDQGDASVTEYNVVVKSGNKVIESKTYTALKAPVRNLARGTEYTVLVRAGNKYGWGPYQSLSFKTPGR